MRDEEGEKRKRERRKKKEGGIQRDRNKFQPHGQLSYYLRRFHQQDHDAGRREVWMQCSCLT